MYQHMLGSWTTEIYGNLAISHDSVRAHRESIRSNLLQLNHIQFATPNSYLIKLGFSMEHTMLDLVLLR
jgi:hypothetical protein